MDLKMFVFWLNQDRTFAQYCYKPSLLTWRSRRNHYTHTPNKSASCLLSSTFYIVSSSFVCFCLFLVSVLYFWRHSSNAVKQQADEIVTVTKYVVVNNCASIFTLVIIHKADDAGFLCISCHHITLVSQNSHVLTTLQWVYCVLILIY